VRSYARVRAGEEVQLGARPVTVHELRVGPVRVAGPHLDVDLAVRCSSGTYVRALARDLGEALGVGGHLVRLRRTAVGPFGLAEAQLLEDLAEDFALLDISEVARRCFPPFDLDEEQSRDVRHGRPLQACLGGDGPVAVFDPAGAFLALYEQRGDDAAPVAVFV
jgi:tRNA pseudouridine55 synthase